MNAKVERERELSGRGALFTCLKKQNAWKYAAQELRFKHIQFREPGLYFGLSMKIFVLWFMHQSDQGFCTGTRSASSLWSQFKCHEKKQDLFKVYTVYELHNHKQYFRVLKTDRISSELSIRLEDFLPSFFLKNKKYISSEVGSCWLSRWHQDLTV